MAKEKGDKGDAPVTERVLKKAGPPPARWWDFGEDGDTLKGLFMEEFSFDGEDGPRMGFRVHMPGGEEVTVGGRRDLVRRMEEVSPGEYIEVTLTGKIGRMFTYEVLHAPPLAGEYPADILARVKARTKAPY